MKTCGGRTSPRMQPVLRLTVLGAALSALMLTGGCAIQPKPFTSEELASINRSDREAANAGVPAINGAVSLDEAIARALKYNLEHRTRMLEQALAAGQLDASRFDMLPRLLANAGYNWRDEENVRRATDSVTGLPSLANPYISSERSHSTWDIGLTWNILDFGASYYAAKQNADRLLIAQERRRKAMHTLIQNVRTSYWRALAAEKLGDQVRGAIQEAEAALADSRKISGELIKSPGEALRYQRNLLENLRLLESVDRELASARIELASLMGIDPGSRIQLVEPADAKPMPLEMPIARMEEIALTQNADLREQFYNARIAATDTRKALLKLLPGISFDYGYKHDDDKYLVNQSWQEAGLRVSFNLFNLLSGPSQMKAAEMGAKVAEARRMALQMAVLTQVHLARQQYDDALRQQQRAEAIWDVDNRLARLTTSQEQSQMASRLDANAANVSAILSSVRRYHAMAKVQEAASRVQATLGLEPQIGSLDEIDLPTLEKRIGESLKHWTRLEAPAQPDAAHPDAAPSGAVQPVAAQPGVVHAEPAQAAAASKPGDRVTPVAATDAWWLPQERLGKGAVRPTSVVFNTAR